MYRHVHDQEAYARLCALKEQFEQQSRTTNPVELPKDPVLVGYFPAYRG